MDQLVFNLETFLYLDSDFMSRFLDLSKGEATQGVSAVVVGRHIETVDSSGRDRIEVQTIR